jgi:hypothetical protein
VSESLPTGEVAKPKKVATYGTLTGWDAHLAADVVGDAKADLLSYHPSNGSWWVTEALPDGTSAGPRKLTTYATLDGWSAHLAADVTGNGVADLVSYHPSRGRWWLTTDVNR